MKKREKKAKLKKYYSGSISFKSNLNGLGYIPSVSELGKLIFINNSIRITRKERVIENKQKNKNVRV